MAGMKEFDLYSHIAKTIAEHGRIIICIGPGPNGESPFAYTIGNQEKGFPELLLFGGGDIDFVLNRLSSLMRINGKPFTHGQQVKLQPGVKMPVTIWDTKPEAKADYTIQAGQFYNNEEYRVQQVVIPDKKGRLPNDPKCNKYYLVPILALDS